jgi:hypothetical protein
LYFCLSRSNRSFHLRRRCRRLRKQLRIRPDAPFIHITVALWIHYECVVAVEFFQDFEVPPTPNKVVHLQADRPQLRMLRQALRYGPDEGVMT